MTEKNLKIQLKQLLRSGYSEVEVHSLAMAPKHTVDQIIAEFYADQRIADHTIQVQHNQANFAMRLGG
ncbi:MAG: hypothetical protein CSA60_04560 [Neptuniibacter caesariensis]|uniref:Uncharacterized protein n=1 Tax=Neptuniibacter caesariensis TaxID=207954 RepID=A0A2G6JIA4_NEPCE|nr:MAG: hypothetical protein CSA60_04560 [Neptuniibacter caesariensis]